MIVAIKRLDSKSNQGEKEFKSEIETLSKLRHKHLVSLIGYCNDGCEMILIYEYMERGTLEDHLHKNKRDGSSKGDVTPLTWKERLNICVGAARGLSYLHNNSDQQVIHRDVKIENILLNLNWVAKIADFGLCKVGGVSSHTHITTGTIGYIDPEYYSTNMLTKKSDVYAFGVVLCETLCGRRVIDNRIGDEQQCSLVKLVQRCCENETVDKLIDASLRGQITTDSLKLYIKLAKLCLHKESYRRPTMTEVIKDLQFLLVDGLNFLSSNTFSYDYNQDHKIKVLIKVKLKMNNEKSRSKALQIVAGLSGVESVAIQGEEKGQLEIVGKGVDSVLLTKFLRKRVGYAELISVRPVQEKKCEEYPYPYPYPYHTHTHIYKDSTNESTCSIM